VGSALQYVPLDTINYGMGGSHGLPDRHPMAIEEAKARCSDGDGGGDDATAQLIQSLLAAQQSPSPSPLQQQQQQQQRQQLGSGGSAGHLGPEGSAIPEGSAVTPQGQVLLDLAEKQQQELAKGTAKKSIEHYTDTPSARIAWMNGALADEDKVSLSVLSRQVCAQSAHPNSPNARMARTYAHVISGQPAVRRVALERMAELRCDSVRAFEEHGAGKNWSQGGKRTSIKKRLTLVL
jgi:hypothetical protein